MSDYSDPVEKELITKNPEKFYEDARSYWSHVPATVDGMLGGFGFISDIDIQGSRKFLSQIYKLENPPGKLKALDCGAGIGRITKNLLVPIFEKVDMVEQNPKFIEGSKAYLGRLFIKINKQFTVGLQDFHPQKEQYDLIWCQWVLGHLEDSDLLRFLRDCKKGFRNNGVLVIKENVTSSGEIEEDTQDSSITRPLHHLLKLFREADMHCLKHVRQTNFPRGLYAVHMFALIPRERVIEHTTNEIDEKQFAMIPQAGQTESNCNTNLTLDSKSVDKIDEKDKVDECFTVMQDKLKTLNL